MTFFFDNNLSWRLAKALYYLEENENVVVHLTELFNANEKDDVWLEHIGRNAMFLVTRDKRIRRHRAELTAIRKHDVGAFILVGNNQNKWEITRQLICQWEKMKELGMTAHRPFAFQVPQRGKITPLPL
jgi:predicted nuclease of predicted toxin-antitoxin system